ncbi:MAG: hypothetical protein ACOYN4_18140 [Bacteroidales bacterium]
MKTFPIIILLVFGLLGCQSQDNKVSGKGPESQTVSSNTKIAEGKTTKYMEVQRPPSANDIFQVSGNCAILLQLANAESDSIKQTAGQNNGENGDDINSSTLEINELLQKLGIKTKSVNRRYLNYVNPANSETVFLDTRKTADYTFGSFIFFSDTKQPEIFESTTLNEAIIKNYFGK